MLKPVKIMTADFNTINTGWCVFDTEASCVLYYLGEFETHAGCSMAIASYERELQENK